MEPSELPAGLFVVPPVTVSEVVSVALWPWESFTYTRMVNVPAVFGVHASAAASLVAHPPGRPV